MFTRILVNGILATISQLIIYYVLLYIGWTLAQFYINPNGMELADAFLLGIEIYVSLVLFGLIVLVTNVFLAILNKPKWTQYILVLPAIIYLIGWGEDFNSWPIKTSLFSIGGNLYNIFEASY